jgi:glutamate-5-semialdehyde dehydrogenase
MKQTEVRQKATLARKASQQLALLTSAQKNEALEAMAAALIIQQQTIISANQIDLQRGQENGISESLLDRLSLNSARIEAMAIGLRQLIDLADPSGQIVEQSERPNGLFIQKVTVPLGVVGMIYEARPNVTVDAAGLCFKTGNAVVLRGGSAALESCRAIVEVLHSALASLQLPIDAIQYITDPTRASVDEMLKCNGLLDVLIPRGGHSLIQNVVQNATVPVIETGAGICHTYLDEFANLDMAIAIAVNAKAQRPSVCNAMETLLVHHAFAERHLAEVAAAMIANKVALRGCPQTVQLLVNHVDIEIEHAGEPEFATEYNDYILNIKIVADLDEALTHIERYGTFHSECIVSDDKHHASRFLAEVDAAAVYHNASTRFTDGFEFGFGAEIGISTQKLHARGPMGLPALTSIKYKIIGNGQIRS